MIGVYGSLGQSALNIKGTLDTIRPGVHDGTQLSSGESCKQFAVGKDQFARPSFTEAAPQVKREEGLA